jgi:hypothetical protein
VVGAVATALIFVGKVAIEKYQRGAPVPVEVIHVAGEPATLRAQAERRGSWIMITYGIDVVTPGDNALVICNGLDGSGRLVTQASAYTTFVPEAGAVGVMKLPAASAFGPVVRVSCR